MSIDLHNLRTACINSIWGVGSHGYAQVPHKGKNRLHHRVAYCAAAGLNIEDIKGSVVMHLCDNKICINPEHLRLGTQAENMADKEAKGRSNLEQRNLTGAANGRALLTAADVLEIRRRAAEPQATLAIEFGVGQTQISKIILRKAWSHLA